MVQRVPFGKKSVAQWSMLGMLVSMVLGVLIFASGETGVRAEAPSAPNALGLTCRIGYASILNSVATMPSTILTDLRAGVYVDYAASANPAQPLGIEHLQMVRIKQSKVGNPPLYYAAYVTPYTYTLKSPSWSQLPVIAQANPGAMWLIANEPDRRDWKWNNGGQDETVPELYAQAYHEIYTVIKAADPTARFAAGGVVEGTPYRIQYLGRMWSAYQQKYGVPMPVDAWAFHEFIVPENRDINQAGAAIPAGIGNLVNDWLVDAPNGRMFPELAPNTPDWGQVLSTTLFMDDLVRYRTWLAAIGQRNKPLILSERSGMPNWVQGNSDVQVADFLSKTTNIVLNATDPNIGFPADGNRLVQSSIWYSLDDYTTYNDPNYGPSYNFGGFLISNTLTLTLAGTTWRDYAQNQIPASQSDLAAVQIEQPYVPLKTSGTTSITVYVDVANVGAISTTVPFSVTLRDDNNTVYTGLVTTPLNGCGLRQAQVAFTLPAVTPGKHTVVAQVDPAGLVPDANPSNNIITGTITVATDGYYLPDIGK